MTEKEIRDLVNRVVAEAKAEAKAGNYEQSFVIGWLAGVLEREIKKPGSTAKLY